MNSTSVKLCDVSFAYKDKNILEHINESFESGKKTAIMAPSGSGKTTLLFLIAGLLKPQSGAIEYSTEKPRISMVFQEDRLLEQQSILCNIQLVNPDITADEVSKMLTLSGLSYNLNTKVNKLSGGEKRRVSIIRALMAEYDILLMDEPFTGLDEKNKTTMMNLIFDKASKKTVILVTHNQTEAKICDTIKNFTKQKTPTL